MSEKGLFGFESLGHGLLELIVGLGAVALGIHFFKESRGKTKKHKKNGKAHG